MEYVKESTPDSNTDGLPSSPKFSPRLQKQNTLDVSNASPGASPSASPGASPCASPGASPSSSPRPMRKPSIVVTSDSLAAPVTLVGSPPSRPDSPIQYPEHPSRKLSYPDRTGEPTRKISASKSEYPAAVETTTIRQRYDSTEDCRPQINGGPRATKDITDFSKADILTISMNDLTSRVPGMLGLAFIFSGFVYLAMFCLVRWFLWSDDGFVLLPVMILSWAGATDMYRLFLGVLLGESGLSSRLSTYTYIYEFSALPLLWITLAQIFSYMSGWWLITVIMKPLAIAFGVNGFNGFMSGIQGEYLVTSDGGVWRHTVNPFTVPYSLIIQPVMIAVAGLLLGFLSLCIYGDALSFLIQVACFAGQALATREPNVGQYFASGLEIIFLANLVYMYIIVI